MTNGKLLTVKEFAQELGLTVSCVRRWTAERRITTVKISRLIRIPAGEVSRLIDLGTRPAKVNEQAGSDREDRQQLDAVMANDSNAGSKIQSH